jgi:hypothetical protein
MIQENIRQQKKKEFNDEIFEEKEDFSESNFHRRSQRL